MKKKPAEKKPAVKKAKKKIVAKRPKAGHPPVPKLTVLELKQIESLAGMLCTWDEIAGVLERNVHTLEKMPAAKKAYAKGKSMGKVSIKRAQYKCGVKGQNPQMLVWLGKVHLHQKDTQAVEMKIEEVNERPASEILQEKLDILAARGKA